MICSYITLKLVSKKEKEQLDILYGQLDINWDGHVSKEELS